MTVDLILGKDLAGGQMGNVTPPPVLREKPEFTAELQHLEDDMPGVFRLCAVTRSMSMTNDHNETPDVDDSLSLGLFANPIASQDIYSAVNAVTGRVAVIAEQEQDDSLRLLFDQVSDSANDSGPTTRYFSQDGSEPSDPPCDPLCDPVHPGYIGRLSSTSLGSSDLSFLRGDSTLAYVIDAMLDT
ncbi:hypothetical protein Hamer_G007091 [Homarus americanus]|uniref:Uncharacterized protein n=1 Tax=Homarus americanus TaxID=6706 RepID=A0A8J5K2E7_HOMAM|nr:hypothetical protein Hamer_G007091 [Homarus americanus]